MSVKLSELKVPPNADEDTKHQIANALSVRQAGSAQMPDAEWRRRCGLAVLYWLREGKVLTHGPKRADLEAQGHGLCAREMIYDGYEEDCRWEADFWTEAAFEGVEP